VQIRRPRPVGDARERAEAFGFRSLGRPRERDAPVSWSSLFIRLLAIVWAASIVAALLDEFGFAAHLPFLLAMGLTGLLVAVSFLWTRPERQPAPEADLTADDEREDDLLTELPTFAYFSRRLHDEFNRSRRAGRTVAVVLIDVNNLSAVNREYGVRAGDAVLRHVARAIDSTRRYNDIAARLGDDEFGVILLDTADQGVSAFVDRLEDRLSRDSAVAEVNGRSVSLWAGICTGSCVSTPDITSPDEVLKGAVASLEHAKADRERRRRLWLTA
jgi:diguanylate cyclase (GGDEF)-like protein